MSELDLVLLTGVWTLVFDTMDLTRIRENKHKRHIQIAPATLKVTSRETTTQKSEVKEGEKPRFHTENKLFL
jgi:hypothetical protein